MNSVPLAFTDGLDPSQFHCIRYIGPPLKTDSFDKSVVYHKFECENGDSFVAALAYSWQTGEKLLLADENTLQPHLLAPFWMRKLIFFRQDSKDSNPKLNFTKINSDDLCEYSGELELKWFSGLGPIDNSTFPYEEVLPELLESKRPLCNHSVLPFVFRGERYLLQVKASEIEDDKVFWFNMEGGSLKIGNSTAKPSSNHSGLLDKLVIDGSWRDDFKVLKFQLEEGGRAESEPRELFLICGIPVPLQEAFVHKIDAKNTFKPLDISRFISDEHLQVEIDDDSMGDGVKYLLNVDLIAPSLMSEILKTTRGRVILISCHKSSNQLIQLEKSARRFSFQINTFVMPRVSENERFLFFNSFLQDDSLSSEFEAKKVALNAFSLADLMRLGFVYRSTNGPFEAAIKIVKGVMNEGMTGESNRGYGILSVSSTKFPFYGYSEVKRELEVLLTGPLFNPEAYDRFGLPKSSGFLIHGPAGCGKTTLCLNLLTCAPLSDHFTVFHVPSASGLLSKYFGETEANIRRLFAAARERKPAIIFIDQIETLGRKRGLGQEASDANDRYLSTLLNEMDGISGNEGVSVIACANDINFLDEALIRPGRLDRHFHLGLPENAEDIEELINGFCADLKIGPESMMFSREQFKGLNGSQIKSLLNQTKQNRQLSLMLD